MNIYDYITVREQLRFPGGRFPQEFHREKERERERGGGRF